jgi:PAP2 superfamily
MNRFTATSIISRLSGALLATTFSAAALLSCVSGASAAEKAAFAPVPNGQLWLAKSYADVKAATSPGNAQSEVAALKTITAKRTADDLERYRWWTVGGPIYRWNEILLDEMQEGFVVLPMAARHLALFHAALDDAVVASRQKGQGSGATKSLIINAALDTKERATAMSPSEYAAAAAAAADVLSYLFPNRAATFAAKAEEAVQSRLLAGVDYPSEVAAGRDIGKKVAALAIDRGKADGSDVKWTGSIPEGADKWKGANPVMPRAMIWQPWVMTGPAEFRPAPPPAIDSEQVKTALAELKAFQRTPKSNHRATYWEVHGGARAHTLWNDIARAKLLEYGYPPHVAARIFATLNIAMADAGIACWDAKFTYWYIRPPQLDAELKSLFVPPNHPSYPAAHGCFSTAAATVLAKAFPRDSERMSSLGKEAAEARVWAGIHYRFDIDVGQDIGRKVGERALAQAFQVPLR